MHALRQPLSCEWYKFIKSWDFPRKSEEVVGSDTNRILLKAALLRVAPHCGWACHAPVRRLWSLGLAVITLFLECFIWSVVPFPFCFPAGIWLLLPLFTSFISRMTVTKSPSQTQPKIQPVIPATSLPPQPSIIPTPVVVGLNYSLSATHSVSVLVKLISTVKKFSPYYRFVLVLPFCRT